MKAKTPTKSSHEIVIRVKFDAHNGANAVAIAQEMRQEVARYWRLSPNTKFVETTLDGKSVPRMRTKSKAQPGAKAGREDGQA